MNSRLDGPLPRNEASKLPSEDFASVRSANSSGGERKRLVLDLLLTSGADVLLLDEPDNYLDIPTRVWLEEQIINCPSTILMVSHDRSLLERVATKIVVLEVPAVGFTAATMQRSPKLERNVRHSSAMPSNAGTKKNAASSNT